MSHDDGRRYTVTQRNSDGKVATQVKYPTPDQALTQFTRSLMGAGHTEAKVEQYLKAWTYILMRGGNGYEVLDPGLNGSISITVSINTASQ